MSAPGRWPLFLQPTSADLPHRASVRAQVWVFWADVWRALGGHASQADLRALETHRLGQSFMDAMHRYRPMALELYSRVHVFPEGVRPCSDDPAIRTGGHFNLNNCGWRTVGLAWSRVVHALTDEQFPGGLVVGVTTLRKQRRSFSMKVWLRSLDDRTAVEAVRQALAAVVDREWYHSIRLSSRREHQREPSGFQHPHQTATAPAHETVTGPSAGPSREAVLLSSSLGSMSVRDALSSQATALTHSVDPVTFPSTVAGHCAAHSAAVPPSERDGQDANDAVTPSLPQWPEGVAAMGPASSSLPSGVPEPSLSASPEEIMSALQQNACPRSALSQTAAQQQQHDITSSTGSFAPRPLPAPPEQARCLDETGGSREVLLAMTSEVDGSPSKQGEAADQPLQHPGHT
eukprot:RCo051904